MYLHHIYLAFLYEKWNTEKKVNPFFSVPSALEKNKIFFFFRLKTSHDKSYIYFLFKPYSSNLFRLLKTKGTFTEIEARYCIASVRNIILFLTSFMFQCFFLTGQELVISLYFLFSLQYIHTLLHPLSRPKF